MQSAEIEGRGLVDKVIQPVAVEQVGAGAPGDTGRTGIVVIGVVVLFPHIVERRSNMLFRGSDDVFMVPHSRHTTVRREDGMN